MQEKEFLQLIKQKIEDDEIVFKKGEIISKYVREFIDLDERVERYDKLHSPLLRDH